MLAVGWFSQTFIAIGGSFGLLLTGFIIAWLIGAQVRQWARRWTACGKLATRREAADDIEFNAEMAAWGKVSDRALLNDPVWQDESEITIPKSPPPQF